MVEGTQHVIDFLKIFDLPVPDLIVRGEHANSTRQFAVVRNILASHASLNHKRRLERWIDQAGASLDNLPAYRSGYFGKTEQEAARAVNWDDVRIRPFTKEEREANWQYMTAGEELFFVKQLALAQERKREVSHRIHSLSVPHSDGRGLRTRMLVNVVYPVVECGVFGPG